MKSIYFILLFFLNPPSFAEEDCLSLTASAPFTSADFELASFAEVFVPKVNPVTVKASLNRGVLTEEFVGPNPYLHPLHLEHRRSLESLGAQITQDRLVLDLQGAALKYNAEVRGLVADKIIQPEEAAFWSRVYLSAEGFLEFRPWEAGAQSAQLFDPSFARVIKDQQNQGNRIRYEQRRTWHSLFALSGLFGPETSSSLNLNLSGEQSRNYPSSPVLSNADYTHAMASPRGCLVPVVESAFLVRDEVFTAPNQSIISHDLAHLLGLRRDLEMMRFQSKAQAFIAQAAPGDRLGFSENFKMINEGLLMLHPATQGVLQATLRDYQCSITGLDDCLEGLSVLRLQEMAVALFLNSQPYVHRIGGSVRTAGMGVQARSSNAFDRAYFSLATAAQSDPSENETDEVTELHGRLKAGIFAFVQALDEGSRFGWSGVWDYFLSIQSQSSDSFSRFHR